VIMAFSFAARRTESLAVRVRCSYQ
jgi:hypothetical protein